MDKNLMGKISKDNLDIIKVLYDTVEMINNNFEKIIENAKIFEKDIDIILFDSCLKDNEINSIKINIDETIFGLRASGTDDCRDIKIIVRKNNWNYYIPSSIAEYIIEEDGNNPMNIKQIKLLIDNKPDFINQIAEQIKLNISKDNLNKNESDDDYGIW